MPDFPADVLLVTIGLGAEFPFEFCSTLAFV